MSSVAQEVHRDDRLNIPKADPRFVAYGDYPVLCRFLSQPGFLPIYITGPTGVGKTSMVREVCAETQRPLIRYNVTSDTDRDHLFGGFRLRGGDTVFDYGPVPLAMRKGAVLLLDEVDLGQPAKLLCLQPILEGASLFIAETGERVDPAPGFTIVATANTKGRGSDTGIYIGTQVQNEAFLERFAVTIDHPYPSFPDEVRMLKLLGTSQPSVVLEQLVTWAIHSRKAFAETMEGAVISPRRLCFIVSMIDIVGSVKESIRLATSRFEPNETASLLSLWEKMTPIDDVPSTQSEVSYSIVHDAVLLRTPNETLVLTPF